MMNYWQLYGNIQRKLKGEGGGDVPQFGTSLKGYTYDHKIKV